MDDKVREFLEKHHGAVMATTNKDGTTHLARIDVGLVDGKLWSSATQTHACGRSTCGGIPRAGLMVMDASTPYRWLGLECEVTILDGDDTPQLNLTLYRKLAGEPKDLDEYLEAMVKEQRVIYEFEVKRAYGMY